LDEAKNGWVTEERGKNGKKKKPRGGGRQGGRGGNSSKEVVMTDVRSRQERGGKTRVSKGDSSSARPKRLVGVEDDAVPKTVGFKKQGQLKQEVTMVGTRSKAHTGKKPLSRSAVSTPEP